MERCLQSELLDELPAENQEAMRSRRDLRRVNVLMGHAGLAARTLLAAFTSGGLTERQGRSCPARPPRMLMEIGAGDGTFFLEVARRLAPRWPGVRVLLLDRQPLVSAATHRAFETLGWSAAMVTDDIFRWLAASGDQLDGVVANLFLHHFSGPQLGELLCQVAGRTSVFIAVEPRRAGFALGMSRLLWVVGCNRVTRHDAVVSVRAGFAGAELSRLWPAAERWRLSERPAGLFSHLFSAVATGP
jgi:hypothetical protein